MSMFERKIGMKQRLFPKFLTRDFKINTTRTLDDPIFPESPQLVSSDEQLGAMQEFKDGGRVGFFEGGMLNDQDRIKLKEALKNNILTKEEYGQIDLLNKKIAGLTSVNYYGIKETENPLLYNKIKKILDPEGYISKKGKRFFEFNNIIKKGVKDKLSTREIFEKIKSEKSSTAAKFTMPDLQGHIKNVLELKPEIFDIKPQDAQKYMKVRFMSKDLNDKINLFIDNYFEGKQNLENISELKKEYKKGYTEGSITDKNLNLNFKRRLNSLLESKGKSPEEIENFFNDVTPGKFIQQSKYFPLIDAEIEFDSDISAEELKKTLNIKGGLKKSDSEFFKIMRQYRNYALEQIQDLNEQKELLPKNKKTKLDQKLNFATDRFYATQDIINNLRAFPKDLQYRTIEELLDKEKGSYGSSLRKLASKGRNVDHVISLRASFENFPGYAEAVQFLSGETNQVQKARKVDSYLSNILDQLVENKNLINDEKFLEKIEFYNEKAKQFKKQFPGADVPIIETGKNLKPENYIEYFNDFSKAAQKDIKNTAKEYGIVLKTEARPIDLLAKQYEEAIKSKDFNALKKLGLDREGAALAANFPLEGSAVSELFRNLRSGVRVVRGGLSRYFVDAFGLPIDILFGGALGGYEGARLGMPYGALEGADPTFQYDAKSGVINNLAQYAGKDYSKVLEQFKYFDQLKDIRGFEKENKSIEEGLKNSQLFDEDRENYQSRYRENLEKIKSFYKDVKNPGFEKAVYNAMANLINIRDDQLIKEGKYRKDLMTTPGIIFSEYYRPILEDINKNYFLKSQLDYSNYISNMTPILGNLFLSEKERAGLNPVSPEELQKAIETYKEGQSLYNLEQQKIREQISPNIGPYDLIREKINPTLNLKDGGRVYFKKGAFGKRKFLKTLAALTTGAAALKGEKIFNRISDLTKVSRPIKLANEFENAPSWFGDLLSVIARPENITDDLKQIDGSPPLGKTYSSQGIKIVEDDKTVDVMFETDNGMQGYIVYTKPREVIDPKTGEIQKIPGEYQEYELVYRGDGDIYTKDWEEGIISGKANLIETSGNKASKEEAAQASRFADEQSAAEARMEADLDFLESQKDEID